MVVTLAPALPAPDGAATTCTTLRRRWVLICKAGDRGTLLSCRGCVGVRSPGPERRAAAGVVCQWRHGAEVRGGGGFNGYGSASL